MGSMGNDVCNPKGKRILVCIKYVWREVVSIGGVIKNFREGEGVTPKIQGGCH